ncbi:MAG: CvpA family protein [Clostridiales bacterium]|jgi:uncharacterized membrane protein required for colicin V production|nr:CvpA family protein [Clostridiales bacterium]
MYTDIAVIALVVVFALLGLWRGFGKTTISIIALCAALAVTVFLTGTVSNWLLNTGFVKNFVTNSDGFSLFGVLEGALPAELSGYEGGELGGVFGMILGPALTRFESLGGTAALGITYQQYFTMILSLNLLMMMAAVLLYFAGRLLAMILTAILKGIFINKDKRPGALSRLLGFVMGGVKGAAWIMALFILLSAVMPFGFTQKVREDLNDSSVGKLFAKGAFALSDYAVYGLGGEKTPDEKLKEYFDLFNFTDTEEDETDPDAEIPDAPDPGENDPDENDPDENAGDENDENADPDGEIPDENDENENAEE